MDPDSLGRAICRDARVMVWGRRRRLANRVPQHRPVRDLELGVHELTDSLTLSHTPPPLLVFSLLFPTCLRRARLVMKRRHGVLPRWRGGRLIENTNVP